MSVITRARNGATRVPTTTLLKKLRRKVGRNTRIRASTMMNAR
jgi:hypothetical protein